MIAILMNYFGPIGEINTNAVDRIPFGKQYYEIAVQIVNAMSGQVVNYMNFSKPFTIGYVLGELAKGLFTVIIYEAVDLLVCKPLGFVGKDGRVHPIGIWNKAKYLLISVIIALLEQLYPLFL